jgi:hypothetical protein
MEINHTRTEQTTKLENYSQEAHSVLNDIWATMLIKYPYTWEKVCKNDPIDPVTNKLTAVALDWVAQLKGIKKSEIKTGINALSNREEKRFPPNAMEFRELCIGSDNEKVLDEVLCRLQQGDSFEWQNQLAFNLWCRSAFDYKLANRQELKKLITRDLSALNPKDMVSLPDYTKEALEYTDDSICPIKKKREIEKLKNSLICGQKRIKN